MEVISGRNVTHTHDSENPLGKVHSASQEFDESSLLGLLIGNQSVEREIEWSACAIDGSFKFVKWSILFR